MSDEHRMCGRGCSVDPNIHCACHKTRCTVLRERLWGIEARAEAAEAQVVALAAALQKVKSEGSNVCAEFDICDHVACKSSLSAYFIADAALVEAHTDTAALLARHRAEQAVITAAKEFNDLYALSLAITMPERIAVPHNLTDALAALAQLEATDAGA